MSDPTIIILLALAIFAVIMSPVWYVIWLNEKRKRERRRQAKGTLDKAVEPRLDVSWGFLVGLLKNGASADVFAAGVRRNDRVNPGWRQEIPDPVKPRGYDIALRPYTEGDDPFTSYLDDIVVNDVHMFRAEQMDDTSWWVCCYLDEGKGIDSKYIMWDIFLKDGEIRWTVSDAPTDVRYEHLLGEDNE